MATPKLGEVWLNRNQIEAKLRYRNALERGSAGPRFSWKAHKSTDTHSHRCLVRQLQTTRMGKKMNAELGSPANFCVIDLVDEAAKAAFQAAKDDGQIKPSIFVILFVTLVVSLIVLWIAFLIWLTIRAIF
jgi:hypothetical protein